MWSEICIVIFDKWYNTLSYDYSRTLYRGQSLGNSGLIIISGYSNNNNAAIDRILLNNSKYRISGKTSLSVKESGSYVDKEKTDQRKLTIAKFSMDISRYFNNGLSVYLKPQYHKGLTIFDAQKDNNSTTVDIPKAQFNLYKLYIQISKRFNVPFVNAPISFSAEIDSQMSNDTLYGSEQFSVGGYYSVRGFKENYISGDHGYYIRNKANFNLGQFLNPILIKENSIISNKWLQNSLNSLYKINIEPFMIMAM